MNKDIYVFVEQELLSKEELQQKLAAGLIGKSYFGLPLRSRSKIAKQDVCIALGYDIPKSFAKTKPKFPCQQFDLYLQKSNNLQIWNDDIDPSRRYAIVSLDENDTVQAVKVIDGDELKRLDSTGALTTKYQARIQKDQTQHTTNDSLDAVYEELEKALSEIPNYSSFDDPDPITLLAIDSLYGFIREKIRGKRIHTDNFVQERTIADQAAALISDLLGYSDYHDDGQFPDLKNQLLEIKLQMSPTIDLGQHLPNETIPIGLTYQGKLIDASVCRYAVIVAHRVSENEIELDDLYIASGEHFFEIFTLFGGKVQNAKLQIPLPIDFWED